MRKRTKEKVDLNAVLQAMGVASSGIDALMRRGVDRDQWSRLASDSAFADCIAATMIDGAVPASIEHLIADAKYLGKLISADYEFAPKHDQNWITKGDHVRGQFHLVNMGGLWKETDLDAALEREAEKLGKTLCLATAYELVYYSSNGWNATDSVYAYGSFYAFPDGDHEVARLTAFWDKPRLQCIWSDAGHRLSVDLVLCISK